MKYLTIILAVVFLPKLSAQEFGSWQSSPPTDWDLFRNNLAAPAVSGVPLQAPPLQLSAPASAQASGGGVGNSADHISPEIQSLAEGLRNDPLAIHRYVTHHIEFEAYYGSKKGANLTLLEKKGNAHDQCALLVALLRAAGHEANYIIGPAKFSYAALRDILGFPVFPLPDHSDSQILALYGGTLPSGFSYLQARQLSNTFNFLSPRGYPIISYTDGENYVFDHVWVELVGGSNNYLLNPCVKTSSPAVIIDILGNSGYTTASFLGAAAGTAGTGSIGDASIKTISEAGINTQLTNMTTTFLNWLKTNHPNISAEALTGKRTIVPRPINSYNDLYPVNTINAPWATVARHTVIPESQMSSFVLTMGDYNYTSKSYTSVYHTETILMPSLCGQKLSLTFSGNNAVFKLDESTLYTQSIPSGKSRLDMDIKAVHDHYRWTWNGAAYVKTNIGRNNGVSNTQKYLKDDGYAYVMPYAFKPSGQLLRQRQKKLDQYLRQGLTNTSEEVRTEVLNIMGLTWIYETSLADNLIVAHEDVSLAFLHRIGRVAQEGSYYIDFLMQYYSPLSRSTKANGFLTLPTSQLFHSAYEHAVVEHLQGGNNGAVSTIKLLHLANQSGSRIFRVDSSNWQNGASIRNVVTGYSVDELAVIDDTVNVTGGYVLLPENGNISLGNWQGAGFILKKPGFVTMGISGGLSGGYNSVTGQVEYFPVTSLAQSDPSYWENGSQLQNTGYTPTYLERYFGADPIDMATGAFVMEKSELELGGAMPRGLRFSRHFNSSRRYDVSAGLGSGWIHNLYGRAVERTSTKGSLGLTSARHVIPTLIATAVARDLIKNDSGSAKDQAVSALVSQWASEKISNNAVSIILGEKTLEFVKMPDSSYEVPAGSTLSLTRNASNKYELTERNGTITVFQADGWIESITDFYGNQTSFTYSGDKLSTVTDAYGRTLTFTWSGNQITKVEDSTSREVQFSYSGVGDLTTATDVEGKGWSYTYTADHQIEFVIDPENRTITQNTYDSLGRVTQQKSMGDITKLWKLYYSGFVTLEEDPQGNIRSFYFDKRGRATGSTNQLGQSNSRSYDGEDHLVSTITEKGEETTFSYNSDNNVTSITDALGHSVQYSYDAQFRLQTLTDKRGKNTSYTYNASHQVLTITDPLAHVTTYGYYSGGLLNTVKDAENKTTTTAYDAMGNVNKVTLQDGTFSSFTSNARGDILTNTDAEGRAITNTWNKRRQLLTSTAPAIQGQPASAVSNIYNDSGNLSSVQDANGNVATHTWNALGKIVTSAEPSIAAGNNVISTTYDSRDWIQKTSNSLSHEMQREYDVAHRMTALIDPLNRRTENTYDANGQLDEAKDPLNRVTKSVWNDRGELTRSTDGESKNTDHLFDKNGNRIKLTDRRGKEYTFVYDDANRLTSSSTPSGKTTSITYFDNNLVKTVQEPSGQTTTYLFNSRNLVSSKSDPTGTVSYGYDDGGLLGTVVEGLDTITRTFDERGKVKSYTNEDGDLLQYKYDGNGNLTRLTYPDGKQVYYTYNARNLLKTVTDWSSRVTTYQYDRLGRMVGVIRPNGTIAVIQRDVGGQVEFAKESANGKLFSLLKFTYDDAGQVKSRFHAPIARSGFTHPSFTGTYDDDNRLLTVNAASVTHDADGNMTIGQISPTSGNIALSYNSRNQLTQADGVSYVYDAEGHRRTMMEASGTTRFVIDPNANMSRLLVKHNPDGTQTYYVYGFGLLYEADEADNTKTYHFDQVGSTIIRTDDSGKVIGEAEYSAYGLIAMKEGDMETPFLYNGQWGIQTDSNGLLNMRARYYSPYLMRFLNSDPIGFSGGQNWFAYADGNPISTFDPFGLWGWRDSLSLTLDFIPVVGTIKAVVEVAAGYDFVAGEDVNRTVAAAGLVASIIPGGKGVVKAGTRIYRKIVKVADAVPLNKVTKLSRPKLSGDLVDSVRNRTSRNSNGNYVDPHTSRELLDGHHIGHITGRENRRLLREAEIRGYNQKQMTEWVNKNPKWFQIEGAIENISHFYERSGNALPWHRIVGDDALYELGASGILSGTSGAINRLK